ncbi:unnamed protein product [Larinioides sclopetarius]|uniref:PHD-type domain-containing protein n=1 Tax=Larinioides sclopetarius TaxID=280406 RepID=A0AAV1ZZW4_9ARAC
MAASEESCDGNPDFAVICSFILKFGDDCGVNVTIPCLQQMLEDTKNVHEDLAELHIHLLRRGRKRVTKERWEKCLIKFCHEYSSVDAWELERFGYKKAKLSVKLEILKRLLELQFDANVKFKTEVNKNDAHSLRIAPIGRDINGQMYWYQLDKDYNMRLYRQGVGDENMWQLVCSNTEHLRNLLSSLEKNITDTTGLISEDTTKAEDIDSTVPKKENDGEDLTSCMSQTKPCAIIIKTEKRENILSGKVSSAAKTPIKDEVETKDSDILLVEKDTETVAENAVASESEEKVNAGSDNLVKPCGVVIKKEMCFDLAEGTTKMKDDTTPMEVDDTKNEKNKDSDVTEIVSTKNDVEMISVESTPVADKGPSSPVVQDASKDSPNATVPPDTTTSSSVEDVPETKFKGSKIKLYEKWSNEKKHIITPEPVEEVKQSLAATNLKESIDTKESLPEDLTVGHKASSESALNKSKSFNVSPNKPLHDDSARGEEVPMDLSVSCRSSDVNKSSATDLTTCVNKKRPLSDLDTSNLSYNGGNVRSAFPTSDSIKTIDMKYPNSSEAPRPLKKKHLSIAKEEPLNVKESNDHNRKSVIFEVKNNKLLNQYQENKSSNDSSSGRTSNSGFSHLQALQNMCNENPMTCFQSNVIHSSSHDKRSSFESSFMKYGLGPVEKSSFNEAACDTLSKKYSFSNTQLSGDMKNVSERTDPPPLLKSNVHASSEVSFKEHFHSKSDASSAPREIHGQKLAAKIDQLVQQNKDFSSDVGKCGKSSNQNLLPTIEKDIGEVKDLHLNEKMKKELKEKSCSRTESVSLIKAELSSSLRKTEKSVSESKVKHTISSMLNTEKAISNSGDSASCTSSFINKPSDVPAIVTSNHTKNILPKHTPDSEKEVLSSPVQKNSDIIKSSKTELKKDSVTSVQDSISEHCIKPEITQSLSLKNIDSVSAISENFSLSKDNHSTVPESKGIDAKSVLTVVSKSREVPLSATHESVNSSEIVEQKTISANFQLEKDNKTSTVKLKEEISISTVGEESSPLSQSTDRSIVGKNSVHVCEEDNSVSKVESTDSEQERHKEITPKNHDSLVICDKQEPADANKDLKSLKDECVTESSQTVTPKEETSEIAESASLETVSCKSEILPPPVEKCDSEISRDNTPLEKSHKETTELKTRNNCENAPLEASALDSDIQNETALNVKQDQSSSNNKELKESAVVPSENNRLHSDKLQNDKTDIKSPSDKSISSPSLEEVECSTGHNQTKLKNKTSKLDDIKPAASEKGIILEKPEVSIVNIDPLENHKTMKSEEIDVSSEMKQIGSDLIIEKPQTGVELPKNATDNQSNKRDVKQELMPAETESSDQKNIKIAKNSETNLLLGKKLTVESEKEIIQSNCDLSDSSNNKDSFASEKSLVDSGETISKKCETDAEFTDKILPSKVDKKSEENVNVSPAKMLPVQSEKEITKTPEKETSHSSTNKSGACSETEIKSAEKNSDDRKVEMKRIETCKTEIVSLSSDDSSQLKSLTTESEKKKTEKSSIYSTVCNKENEDTKSSVINDSNSGNISVVPSETENKETSQIDTQKMKLQGSKLEKGSVVSETPIATSDLKTPENKVTEKLETSTSLPKTKSIDAEQGNKSPIIEENSIEKASVNDFESEIDSKSSVSVNCLKETSTENKSEEICLPTKNDPTSELKREEPAVEDILPKQLQLETAIKIKHVEISSETEITSDQSKDKTEVSKHESNSESLDKEISKTKVTDIQQKNAVSSSVSSTKLEVKEGDTSQQQDILAKESLKTPCSTDIKNTSNKKETPKLECREKIEDDKAINKEDTAANSVAAKKGQRTSNRASRSSRKKSRASHSVCKEENKASDDLSTKSDPAVENSIKDENTTCETRKKEVEQIKIKKNDKHIHSEDVKMDCDTTSITDKETMSKEIKKESLDVSEKTICSGKETKYDSGLHKLDVQNPLNLYLVMNCRCLETKGRHPQCGKLSEKPLLSTSPSKPKLITTFSLDTIEEVQIIKSVDSPTMGKKKRGRLRQRGSVSKSPAPPPPPPPKSEPVKSTPKTSRQRAARNSKKAAATSGKDDFTIPEGFLEILSNSQSDTAKVEPRRKSRGQKAKISTPSAQSSESESAPIKRSRRIQEQHQKKMSELAVEMEREQRMLEQLAKKSKKPATTKSPIKTQGPKTPRGAKAKFEPPTPEDTCLESKRTTRKMNSRSRNMTKMTLMYEDESKDSEFSTSRETEKSKKRRRGKGARKGYKPWDLSSESSSSIEEITEEEEEEEPDEPLIFEVNEDEFACEEVDEDAEPIIVRRARTAKKAPEDTNTEENVVTDDKPCSKCGKYDKPEWILLCDKCDNGYHTTCLIPPLVIIPEGDWYCQPCEHTFLCETLQKELHNLEVILKQREREELRKQRLAYVGISLDNVLKPEKKEKSDESSKEEEEEEEEINETERKRRRYKESSDEERQKKLYGKRSVRARRNVNYQFKEYDALIASAIQEEMLDKLTEDEEDIKEKEKSEESDKSFTAKLPPRRGGRRKRAKRLNDLDFSDEDEDSGDEYKGSSSDSEQTAPPSKSGSDAESAASGEWRIVKTKARSARKPRRKRRDSSDEEWDGNESETYRPTTRRAAQKAVSYKEISSDDDDEWDPKPKSASKKRKKATSSEDSETSYKKKKPKRKSRVRKWASSSSEEESEHSMSFSGSSQGSEDEWKVKKSSEGNKIKININKKVLSSDENDESQESAPKKRPNKVTSDPESEEEEDEEDEEEESSEEEEDEEEDDDDDDEEDDDDDEEEEEDENVKVKKSKDILSSKPKDIPSKPKDVPSKPKDVPSKPNDVPSKPNDVPSKPYDVPSKPNDVPSKPNDAPSKPNDAPSKPNDVPTKLKDMPLKLNDITPKPKDMPSKPVVEPNLKNVTPKAEVKSVPIVKEPVKVDAPKLVEMANIGVKKESPLPVVEPIKEKVVVMTVKNKPPQRTVKKDATKMVPCVIPYDKSPKSGHGAIADEEGDKEINKNKTDSTSTTKHLSFPKMVTTSNVIRAPNPSSKPFTSTIIQPFSNIDDENDSDDEVPLERIPTTAPTSIPTKSLSFTRDSEYTPAKELSGFSYTTPEEKCFPPTYSSLAPFQDYSSRPSPLKPSLVETYSNNSSPSKLTPLDSYSNTNSPKGFISLDSYSDSRKKKQHFYGTPEPEAVPRPVPSEGYQGEIRFPPSPSTYAPRSPPHVARDAGTPPRFHSQYPDTYAPPRSPEYYQNQPYYQGEERIPRSTYQPNYVPPEPVPPFVPNPYVATPVMQPNGGFMIDTLLRARNPENEEDELTGVTDIVSYITQE